MKKKLLSWLVTCAMLPATAMATGTQAVAKVNGTDYTDIQEAIKAAAPSGTVDLLADVTVEEWVMISETLSISNGNIITIGSINGLTINGNNHTLTINSIESASNGNRLFYDATNLNIHDLTITYANGVAGGIGLTSGTIENVTFSGGVTAIYPGAGDVTVRGCTFATNGTAIYYQEERDDLVVTGNTFDQPDEVNVILLRGDTTFTGNTVNSGRTVNVVSGSPVVTGNDFGDVRLKVYDAATASIENNTINVLAFEDDSTEVKSTFTANTLSDDAKTALAGKEIENASYVAQVGETKYADLQEAIKAAAPSDTVEVLADVTVEKWVMISETLSISNGNIITIDSINGLTIDGNGHTLTINSIESAGNVTRLFYDATNLNIHDLTITYANGVAGGIGLTSGTIENVAFNGGVTAVYPGAGNVTISGCTFATNGTAIYHEEERDTLVVTGNTFNQPDEVNVILLRGDTTFTDNTINNGRTVNVVSGSPVVSGNTFADGVRLKVYNNATGEIIDNTITVLAFNDDSTVKSKFEGNILSADAQAVLDGMNIENTFVVTISVPDGATIVVKDAENSEVAAESAGTYNLPNGNYTYSVSKSGYYTKAGNFTVNNAVVDLTVELTPRSSSGGGSYTPSYIIAAEDAKNGNVAVSPSRASSGSTVTITVDPDEDYELDSLTVLDKNGKEVKLTKKSDTKYTFKMPSGKVTIEATFAEIAAFENPFVDVTEGAYYYDAVLWAAENGITGGTSATTFSPSAACTRAQTVTFLWRAAGSPEPESTKMPFTDVSADAYYYKAVLWAAENGITGGTSATTFSPDATVTRAQNVTFLWRWAESPAAEQANSFADVAADAYYHGAVAWAAEEEITSGTSATTFSPDDPCLRSQIVTFLYRYMVG